MNKIIFVNRFFYPDHSATSQILSDLAFGLAAETDKEIHIVTSQQRYEDPAAKLSQFEKINNVHVHRIKTTQFGRDNLVGRSVDYLSFYFSAALKLLQITKKDDVLIAKTDPPLISVIVGIVSKLKNAQLINWLQDLFPEVAAELGIKLARGYIFTILIGLRNKALQQATMNVVIGDLMAKRLRKLGVTAKQITVVHNWADGEQIRPVPHEQNPLRTEWGLQGKFVVGYSGNFGRSHEFSTILAAVEILKDDPGIKFLFIGAGAKLPLIKLECQEKGLNNVVFKPYQPREKLHESLSVSDVHLISLKPELEGLIVPSKFYGILAAGRPVFFIGDKDGELSSVIKQEHCGNIIQLNDVDMLVTSIKNQMEALDLALSAQEIRTIFDTKYSKSEAIAKFKRVLGV